MERFNDLLSRAKSAQLHLRLVVYIVGLFVAAFGVVLSVNSALGVSPVNSFPFIVSQIIGLSMGTCVAIVYTVLILIQYLILRKNFRMINFLQLLASSLFGYFVDLSRLLLGGFHPVTYAGQLSMQLVGTVLISFGIATFMIAKLINMPTEGVCTAVSHRWGVPFHRAKITMDSSFAIMSLMLSLVFLGGVYGIREGTFISAILIGKLIPHARKVIIPTLNRMGIHTPE